MPKANLANDTAFVNLVKIGRLTCTKTGIVRNVKTGRVLNKVVKKTGYVVAHAIDPKTKKTRMILVHRLVYNLYHKRIKDPYLEVNHRDGNTQNNSIGNLEETTHDENIKHSTFVLKRDRSVPKNKAQENGNAKFTNVQVAHFRKLFATKNQSYRDLAEKLKIHPVTLLGLLRCTTYSSVKTKYDNACKAKLPTVGKGNIL
jgi:hypothetical protein